MILSNLKKLKVDKEREWGHKITYDLIKQHAQISSNTIARLMSLDAIDRIDGKTLDGLCRYFECQVGDILEYISDTKASKVIDATDAVKGMPNV